ncbi:MAG: NAD(P)-binding domain-containing protein, partial [Myxococcota bacterium]
EVMLGSRRADNDAAAAWATKAGERASHGTFADAAAFAELVFNCTAGVASLAAIEAAGRDNLAGKILIDVSNPLDFSDGFPPSLSVSNTDSLGEQVQRALPETKVVKALNTVANHIMVDPSSVPGAHDLLVCGNDAEAKAAVTTLLRRDFGWEHFVDVGDITAARATEAWLLLWTRLYGAMGNADFNLRIVRKDAA